MNALALIYQIDEVFMVITVIGMPGCGKSCLGRAIAGKLKMKQVDTDKLIERRYGKSLATLIQEFGCDGFRKIEEETLLSIFNKEGENLLLSTGGSAIYSEAGIKHLKSLGKLVYLYCSYPTIEARLGDFSKRGIVLRPGQSLRSLYDERCPLYEKYADIKVNCDGTFYSKYQRDAIKAISELLLRD